jgi:riboflavin biosynthesis pyrimidine reductase
MYQLWPNTELAELDDVAVIDLYRPARRKVRTIRVNFVASLDGACTLNGRSGGLSDAADKRVFDILRMLSDVLLVGAGTFRNEGYCELRLRRKAISWRVAHGLPEHPVLAIVSNRLDLEPDHSAFVKAPRRPLIITHGDSPAEQRSRLARNADVLVCGDHSVDFLVVAKMLESRGINQILCEGGPRLFTSLLAADVVDELCLTFSPLLTGPEEERVVVGAAGQRSRMSLAHVLGEGDTVLTRYLRRK